MSCSSSFVLPSHTHAKQNTLTWSLVHLHPACLHFSFCLLTARSSIRFFHPAARARLFAPSASCGLRAVWRNVLQFLTPKKRICCAPRSRRHLRSPCRARTPRITTVSRLVLQHSTHLVLVHLHRVDFGRLEDRRTRLLMPVERIGSARSKPHDCQILTVKRSTPLCVWPFTNI